MNDFQWKDLIAIYGAALSTFVAVVNILQRRSSIKVELIAALQHGAIGAMVSIQNHSSAPVHAAALVFHYRYRRLTPRERLSQFIKYRAIRRQGWVQTTAGNVGIDAEMPVKIEPGTAHDIFVHRNILEEHFGTAIDRTILVSVQDQLWRNTYSKIFRI